MLRLQEVQGMWREVSSGLIAPRLHARFTATICKQRRATHLMALALAVACAAAHEHDASAMAVEAACTAAIVQMHVASGCKMGQQVCWATCNAQLPLTPAYLGLSVSNGSGGSGGCAAALHVRPPSGVSKRCACPADGQPSRETGIAERAE